MKVFLAGVAPWRENGIYDARTIEHHPYILESFYYVNSDTERLLPSYGDFLLDSGAFTFMQNAKVKIIWEEYVNKFAEYVNKHDIKKFFELDIDSLVGYEKVLKYRERLEQLTGKKPIPVWHKSRGIEEFQKMCSDYPYVAIGGIVTKEIKENNYSALPSMIKEAHARGAEIHGLGFTSLDWLPKCHFDSVDSTAWTTGNRFGFIYKFNGTTMKKIDAPKGYRLGDPKAVAINNFMEWIKFQKYAETHL